MSQTYAEVMAMRPAVSYIPCDTSSKEQTGNIITLSQFEEGNLLSKTREDVESDDKSGEESDEDLIMPPLISVEETNALDSGDESDDEPMSTYMLEHITKGSQSNWNVNR